MTGWNTDRSKDIPGKDGYSVRDQEKLFDVVKNYEPISEKKGCPLTILLVLIKLTTIFGLTQLFS